ncbi:hypothetical protein AKG33_01910, partial [Dichelobacter nodosus]
NPDKPTDPENPTNPVDPENPDKPTDPENPTNPVDPENPDKPTDPEPEVDTVMPEAPKLEAFSDGSVKITLPVKGVEVGDKFSFSYYDQYSSLKSFIYEKTADSWKFVPSEDSSRSSPFDDELPDGAVINLEPNAVADNTEVTASVTNASGSAAGEKTDVTVIALAPATVELDNIDGDLTTKGVPAGVDDNARPSDWINNYHVKGDIKSADGSIVIVDTAGGRDSLIVDGDQVNSIVYLGNDNDIEHVNNVSDSSIFAGKGNDAITIDGNVANSYISTGGSTTIGSIEGSDTINIGGNVSGSTIDLGSGLPMPEQYAPVNPDKDDNVGHNAQLTVDGSFEHSTVHGSQGVDMVEFNHVGDGAKVELGNSDDILVLSGTFDGSAQDVMLDGGAGSDTLVIGGSGSNLSIASLKSFETINLDEGGHNLNMLDFDAFKAFMGDNTELYLNGDNSNHIFMDKTGTWTRDEAPQDSGDYAPVDHDGYHLYTSKEGGYQLYISKTLDDDDMGNVGSIII